MQDALLNLGAALRKNLASAGIAESDWIPYIRHLFNVYDESRSGKLEKVELLELLGDCICVCASVVFER